MELLDSGLGWWLLRGALFVVVSMLSFSAHADIYKCTAGGAVSYQETPCEGAHVQTTHIESRSSAYFEGCFSAVGTRYTRSVEVRPNGAGTYRLIDERNPLGTEMELKQATHAELVAMSTGLHLKVSDGLSRNSPQQAGVTVYSTRFGNRYYQSASPAQQAITPSTLYGIYRGTGSEGQPITLLYSGGTPQIVAKGTCPQY